MDTIDNELIKPFLLDALEAYETTRNTLPLELALDRAFYTYLWDSISNLAKGDRKWAYKLLGMRIDLLNLLTILRGVNLGMDASTLEQLVIPVNYTYNMKNNLAQAMTSSTLLEVLRFLSVRPYVGLCNRIREIIEDDRSLVEVEQLVDIYLAHQDSKVFIGYPFHIGTVLAFLNIFYVEVRNLKTIFVGKIDGVPVEKIRKFLIFAT